MFAPLITALQASVLLLLALAGDAWLSLRAARRGRFAGPGAQIRRLIQRLDRRLNRLDLPDSERFLRGAALALILPALAFSLGVLLIGVLAPLRFGWLLEGLLLAPCLALRQPWERVRQVGHALSRRDLATARSEAQPLTFRATAGLDPHAVARIALEALAKTFHQDLVTPVFWFLLAGLPAVLAWTVLNGIDAIIGHRGPRHIRFGQGAAVLSSLASRPSAWLAAALLAAAAACLKGTRPRAAWTLACADSGQHRSASGGWPEAALAGALGVSLSGPWLDGGVTVDAPWIGGAGRARIGPADIRRALALYGVAGLLLVLLAGLGAGLGAGVWGLCWRLAGLA